MIHCPYLRFTACTCDSLPVLAIHCLYLRFSYFPCRKDGSVRDFLRAVGHSVIEAGVDGPVICHGHLPEGVFDDDRSVGPDAEFQVEDMEFFVAPEEVGVGGRGPAPALVLDEAVVRAQVHGHIRAVHRAFGDQAGRDPHQEFPVLRNLKDSFPVFDKTLGLKCLHDPVLIVPGDAEGGVDALEKAVVSLGIKKSLFVKAGSLELVVHVGGDDKIVFIADQVQKLPVDRFRRIQIAVDVDISGPESPGDLRFQAHHIEAARIHVVEAVFFFEIKEIFFEINKAVVNSYVSCENIILPPSKIWLKT